MLQETMKDKGGGAYVRRREDPVVVEAAVWTSYVLVLSETGRG